MSYESRFRKRMDSDSTSEKVEGYKKKRQTVKNFMYVLNLKIQPSDFIKNINRSSYILYLYSHF